MEANSRFKTLLGGRVSKEKAVDTYSKLLGADAQDKAQTLNILNWIDEMMTGAVASRNEIGRAVLGQEKVINNVLLCLFAGGNPLLTSAPGLGKTVLANSIGKVLGLSVRRVQGTPDLMPSDITGSEILVEEEGKRAFKFVEGPIFANLLLFDEINRASARTQAGTLQPMQEGQVSAGGETHDLPDPNHLLATRNPLEQEGTNEMPEAQLDRFLMDIEIDYPSRDAERQIMEGTTTTQYSWNQLMDKTSPVGMPTNALVSTKQLATIFDAEDIKRIQHLVRKLPLTRDVGEAILDLVRSLRPGVDPELDNKNLSNVFNFVAENVAFGPGPRACQALSLLVRANALMRGDLAPTVQDVLDIAPLVLGHRMKESVHARTLEPPESPATIIEKISSQMAPR